MSAPGVVQEFDLSAVSEGYFRARLASRYFILALSPGVLIFTIAGYLARSSPPASVSAWAGIIGVFAFAGGLATYLSFGALVHMARGAEGLRIDHSGLTFRFPSSRQLLLPWSSQRFRLVVHDHRAFHRSGFPIRVLFPWHPYTALTPEALEAIEGASAAWGLSVTKRVRSTISYGRLAEVRIARE